LLIEVMTDNKKRTAAEIRHALSRLNGNLGEAGCVSWMFGKKGYISFDKKMVDSDKIMEIALDSGAEDVSEDEHEIEVVADVSTFESVRKVFDNNAIKYIVAEISMVPRLLSNLKERMLKRCSS